MKDHTSRHQITIRDLWEVEHLTYRELSERIHLSHGSVSRRARELSFRRRQGGGKNECGYEVGPCVQCEVPYPRAEIGDDFRCPVCAQEAELAPYHLARWGRRPHSPQHPDWFVLEKMASRFRTARKEPRRTYTRLPDSHGGGVPQSIKRAGQ